jgi:hypothetical protein
MKRFLQRCSAVLFGVFLFFLITHPTYAVQPLLESTKDGSTAYSSGCISDGDCELNDFIVLAVRVSQIILGLTGSLSLLAFFYGGFLFLISAGNAEMVGKAKKTILYAVIGIVIVFFSYTIVTFIGTTLGVTDSLFKITK